MKRVTIFGEFLERSTTGIAYMNSLLESTLKGMGFNIIKLYDPRTIDYQREGKVNKNNFNFLYYIKLFQKLILLKRNNIFFLTLSDGNLGLIKNLLTISLVRSSSDYIYLFIHRGDLYQKYKSSKFKQIFIKTIFYLSDKIIFLSFKFRNEMNFLKNESRKFKVLSNCLNKIDLIKSSNLYKTNDNKKLENKYRCIFSSNIHESKGIYELIDSINILNKAGNKTFYLDLYGMLFDNIELRKFKNISYKGKLEYNCRLQAMSCYDFLILPSETEGLPIILLECMAIGLPFITTNVGAIEEIVGKDYPYFCEKNTNSIIDKINLIANDFINNKIQSVIKLNREKLLDLYNYENYSKNLKNLISK